MKHSEQINELAAALAKAQGAIRGAIKDASNPHFRSRYATLAAHVEAIREAFAANGLSYSQMPVTTDNCVGVETILMHASGQWLAGDAYYVPVSKADAQGFGSALTYCRRYALAAIAGIAPEDDDDGNAATAAAPTASRALSTADFGRFKVAIGTATDEAALKRAYTEAYVAAQRAGDSDAMIRLTDLKDSRKEELSTAKTPA